MSLTSPEARSKNAFSRRNEPTICDCVVLDGISGSNCRSSGSGAAIPFSISSVKIRVRRENSLVKNRWSALPVSQHVLCTVNSLLSSLAVSWYDSVLSSRQMFNGKTNVLIKQQKVIHRIVMYNQTLVQSLIVIHFDVVGSRWKKRSLFSCIIQDHQHETLERNVEHKYPHY